MKFLNFNGLVKLLWTDLHRKHVIPHQSFPTHSPPKAKDYKYTNLFKIIRAKSHVKVIRTVIIFFRFSSIVFIIMALPQNLHS